MRLIDADAFWAQFEEGENKLSFMKSIFPPEIIDVTLKIYAELKERLDSMPAFEPQTQWVPISERLPDPDTYVLLSFENFSLADIGRYERDEAGGAFYPGEEDRSYASFGIFVNAWMPLPERWEGEDK